MLEMFLGQIGSNHNLPTLRSAQLDKTCSSHNDISARNDVLR